MPMQSAQLAELSRMDRARMAGMIAQRAPRDADRDDATRGAVPADEDEEQFLPVATLRQQYLDYLTTKIDEIEEQKLSRRYYHGAQLNDTQLRILRDRRQLPQVWNRTARKINQVVGLVERMRSDPKAAPKRPDAEAGAQIASESIRNVLDGNSFRDTDFWTLLQVATEAIGGVQMVLRRGDKGDIDVGVDFVIGDEYFYDPKSYRWDSKDKRYEGLGKWLDLDEAISLLPHKEAELRELTSSGDDLTTNADREYAWVMTTGNAKRLRLVEHWYKHRGKWCWAFYVSFMLLDQGVSPFYDERGQSSSSFEMYACAIDQDGDRYSLVRNLKDPQDALNQGKSKTAHLAGTKTVVATKGVVDDVETARREIMRSDGYVEKNPGGEFTVVDTKPDLAVYQKFTEDALAEIDSFANTNAAAANGLPPGSAMSGRALEILRQPGMAELGPLLVLGRRAWKLRLYRKIWNAIQRYWTAERWLRVNHNDKLYQFIQLNGTDLDQWGRPVMVNAVGQIDVDIELDEGRDVATLMRELADDMKSYPPGTFPPQVLIEMSDAPRSEKDRILALMVPKPPPPGSPQEMALKLQLENAAGQNAKLGADIADKQASAEQRMARAAKDRAGVATEAAKAGHLAHSAHLDAATFARDTLIEAHNLAQSFTENQSTDSSQAPMAGARQGRTRDGRAAWFVPDPQRPGKHLQVVL